MSHKTGGTNTTKDVIYIDVDDEITGIIDKVRGSGKKIVALVLPKRATVLQSVVNMKLLKRATTESKKNLVLITSESGLLPLAGSIGIHVAKSLSSKPEIPDAPEHLSDRTETVEDAGEVEDAKLDGTRTVGELAGARAEDSEESIELDDDQAEADDGSPTATSKSKRKKFKIPNFNKFRVILVLAVVGVLVLGSVGYAAAAVWPKAKITIKTDSQAINSTVTANLQVGPDVKLEADKGILQAQRQEVKKTLTQEAPATGQLNNGQKATGTIKFYNCSKIDKLADQNRTINAGTGVSIDGLTFITDSAVTVEPSSYSGDTCQKNKPSPSVGITAQKGGANYNHAAGNYTVSGTFSAVGSETTGGTDSIAKMVTQADIDNAKQKITEQDTKPIQQELRSALVGRGLFALDATFSPGAPETKLSVEANSTAEAVTVTQTITYTMLGAKQEDLEKIIASDIEKKIDDKKQAILSHGLDTAFFTLQGLNAEGATLSLQTTAVAGPELHVATIKSQVAGKKAGDAKEIISAYPGITDVTVTYSPFWVSSIPKKQKQITVIIQEPEVRSNDAESSP